VGRKEKKLLREAVLTEYLSTLGEKEKFLKK